MFLCKIQGREVKFRFTKLKGGPVLFICDIQSEYMFLVVQLEQ